MGKGNKIKSIKKDFKESDPKEIWVDGVLTNFIYGFIQASVIVMVTLGVDIAVLLAYLTYYFYLGKVVNRPKYVTSLGKFIIFPVPAAIGAFVGYKLGPIILTFINLK